MSCRTARSFLDLATAGGRMLLPALLGSLLGACATTKPEVAQDARTRTPIVLHGKERDHFVAGMHAYLDAIQAVVDGVAASKLERVAESARKVGTASILDASPVLAIRLPSEFVMMSLDTHQKFDALAASAERKASKKELLDQLSAVLSNCGACHGMYRLAVTEAAKEQAAGYR